MRYKLEKYLGTRITIVASVKRYGARVDYVGNQIKTILLGGVKTLDGDDLTDHIWFTCGKSFENLRLQIGDTIQFQAKPKRYMKGYVGRRDVDDRPIQQDIKLCNPTKIVKRSQKNAV